MRPEVARTLPTGTYQKPFRFPRFNWTALAVCGFALLWGYHKKAELEHRERCWRKISSAADTVWTEVSKTIPQ